MELCHTFECIIAFRRCKAYVHGMLAQQNVCLHFVHQVQFQITPQPNVHTLNYSEYEMFRSSDEAEVPTAVKRTVC